MIEMIQYGYVSVDAARGSDQTGVRDSMTRPFKTLKAAFPVIQDNDTVLIGPGIYRESPIDSDRPFWELPQAGAALVLSSKSNVTFQGIGRPLIYFTAHNNGLMVDNCVNCRFLDFSIQGQGYKRTAPGRYYALFLFNGVNRGHLVQNVYGMDSGDHILAHLAGPRTIFDTTVRDCRFYRCGQMILGSPWPDGVAVGLGGYGNRIVDNYFEECNRCIEIESGVFPGDNTEAKRIYVTGNTMLRPWAHPILITPIHGKVNLYAQMIISQNIIQGWGRDPKPDFGGHWAPCGMWITGMTGGVITENVITDLWDGTAIQVEAANGDVANLLIAHNEIQRIGRTGISLTVTDWVSQGKADHNFQLQFNQVSHNHISDCQGRAIWIYGDYNTVDMNTVVNSDYAGLYQQNGICNVYRSNRLFDCGGAAVPGHAADRPIEVPDNDSIENEIVYIKKTPPVSGTN